VAAGLATFALGTDTNGSVRVPSSFCGVWGLKPTYACLSRAGVFPFVDALDTVGTLARSVSDLTRTFDAMAGPDARDPNCGRVSSPLTDTEIDAGVRGVRVAALEGYFARGRTTELSAALAAVAGVLGSNSTVELPRPDVARSAAFLITAAEAGELHRERLVRRAADFDPASRDRFIAGLLAPAAWYLKAQRFRAWWKGEVARIFETVDVLIAPATPMSAPGLDEQTFEFDGATLPLRANVGLFTQPITLVGLPVVAAPIHQPGRMPTAVQLIGRPGSELTLLRVARELERQGVCSAPLALGS
jgi:aspartyl-tRNA(Asn)/glutamyl-tRNA(Gln) amidotransferase subunit A